jgi:hypothetical protein
METEVAVEKNDRAQRQMLMDIHADIQDLLAVDYDQVQWQVVAEAASLASTLVQMIKPGPNEIE